MNKIKKTLFLAFTFLCFASVAFAQCPDGDPSCESFPATPPPPCDDEELGIVFSEDFDGSNTFGVAPVFSLPCYNDGGAYFNVVCDTGGGCANEVSTDYVYMGATGQYLGARDVSDCIGPFDPDEQFVSFNGIDVSSCTGPMTLCFSVAETRNMGGADFPEYGDSNMRPDTWDSDTEVNVTVNIDGAGAVPVTSIQAAGNSDTRPGIDLGCTGTSEGGPELTPTFTQYCFQLPTTGSTLDLEFEFLGFTTDGEDIAIDNIVVMCPDDMACIPLGLTFPACTPPSVELDGEIWIEDFDGGNGTNPPSFTFSCYDDDRDYFDIVCTNGNCPTDINDDYAYFGADGQFLGLRDTDGGGPCNHDDTLPETVSFDGIDISSCGTPEILYLCFSIAETQNVGGANGNEYGSTNMRDDTWDGNTSVMVFADIDGAGALPVTAFEAQVGSDSTPGVDLNCDGDSGDAGEVNLTATFTQYCFNLPNNGTTADIDFQFTGFNTGGEDVGIDNISIQCGLPAGTNVLPGKTPFTP